MDITIKIINSTPDVKGRGMHTPPSYAEYGRRGDAEGLPVRIPQSLSPPPAPPYNPKETCPVCNGERFIAAMYANTATECPGCNSKGFLLIQPKTGLAQVITYLKQARVLEAPNAVLAFGALASGIAVVATLRELSNLIEFIFKGF